MKIVGLSFCAASSERGRNFFVERGVSEAMLDEWGIRTIRRLGPGENLVDLEVLSAERAIGSAGLSNVDIDLIIASSFYASPPNPASGHRIAAGLGLNRVEVLTIDLSGCSGLYSLSLAQTLLTTQPNKYRNILIVTSNEHGPIEDPSNPLSFAVTGDGAASVVVSGAEGKPWCYQSDFAHEFHDQLGVRVGENGRTTLFVEPSDVLRLAMRDSIVRCLNKLWLESGELPDSVDWVCAHQNIAPVSGLWPDWVGIPSERWIQTREKYGNMINANVFANLSEGLENRRIVHGHKVLLLGHATGIVTSALLLEV